MTHAADANLLNEGIDQFFQGGYTLDDLKKLLSISKEKASEKFYNAFEKTVKKWENDQTPNYQSWKYVDTFYDNFGYDGGDVEKTTKMLRRSLLNYKVPEEDALSYLESLKLRVKDLDYNAIDSLIGILKKTLKLKNANSFNGAEQFFRYLLEKSNYVQEKYDVYVDSYGALANEEMFQSFVKLNDDIIETLFKEHEAVAQKKEKLGKIFDVIYALSNLRQQLRRAVKDSKYKDVIYDMLSDVVYYMRSEFIKRSIEKSAEEVVEMIDATLWLRDFYKEKIKEASVIELDEKFTEILDLSMELFAAAGEDDFENAFSFVKEAFLEINISLKHNDIERNKSNLRSFLENEIKKYVVFDTEFSDSDFRNAKNILARKKEKFVEMNADDFMKAFKELSEQLSLLVGVDYNEIYDKLYESTRSVLAGNEFSYARSHIREIVRKKLSYDSPVTKEDLYFIWRDLSSDVRKTFAQSISNIFASVTKGFKDIAALKAAARPEVPKRAKGTFDDFIFADHRKDVPSEPDNAIEKKVYEDLKNHFNVNIPVSETTQKILLKALEKGWYKKIVHAPNEKYIYRGLRVDRSYLEKALKTQNIEDTGNVKGSGTYKPKDGAFSTSWSTSVEKALSFSSSYDEFFSVFLKARVSDNEGTLVACPEGLYSVRGLDQHRSEKEVITLKPVKIMAIYWSKGSAETLEKIVKKDEMSAKLRAKGTGLKK